MPSDYRKLNAEFRNLVTDLTALEMEFRADLEVKVRAKLSGWLNADAGRVSVVRDGLERVLADRTYRDLYLDFLGKLQERSRPLRPFALFTDSRKHLVLEEGLSALDAGDLAVLAIDPVVFADVWDAISDEFSPYWQQAARLANEQYARERGTSPFDARAIARNVLADVFAEFGANPNDADDRGIVQGQPESGWAGLMPAGGQLTLAALDAGHKPTTEPPHGELNWSDEIPFRCLEIVAAYSPTELELRQQLRTLIEYRWQPAVGHGSRLTMWLSGALIVAGAVCTARLLDARGVERVQATAEQGSLVFPLTDVDHPGVLSGWTIACDYRKDKFFDARFTAVLQPPDVSSGLDHA